MLTTHKSRGAALLYRYMVLMVSTRVSKALCLGSNPSVPAIYYLMLKRCQKRIEKRLDKPRRIGLGNQFYLSNYYRDELPNVMKRYKYWKTYRTT